MKTLSEQTIIEKIIQREHFEATIDGGAFNIKIERYEPALYNLSASFLPSP